MNPKIITDFPFILPAGLAIAQLGGFISLKPSVIFFIWVFMFISAIFLMSANVITGGYKNDWHRNKYYGESWRESTIATIFLSGFFAILILSVVWEKVGSPSQLLLFGTIIICCILSYLTVKFRYKIFEIFTPEEKETPIKLGELRKYIRWYHWLIFLLILIILLPRIFELINLLR